MDDICGPLDDKCLVDDSTVLIRCEGANLPIILTAPHGGSLSSPISQILKARTPGKGICTKSDLHTMRLLNSIDESIFKLCGMRPHIVAARFHRKYIDANRNSEVSVQQPYHPKCELARVAYEEYHQTVEDCIAHCGQLWPNTSVLLLDIHGQRIYQDYIVLGTRNGNTYHQPRPCEAPSSAYVTPGHDFINLLRSDLGLAILPHSGEADLPAYSGGYTVGRHSSPGRVDGIQLEFGSTLRSNSAQALRVAQVVAAAATRIMNPQVSTHSMFKTFEENAFIRANASLSGSRIDLTGIVSKLFIPGRLVGPAWETLRGRAASSKVNKGPTGDHIEEKETKSSSYSVQISQHHLSSGQGAGGREEKVSEGCGGGGVFEGRGRPSLVQTAARLEAHHPSPACRALCRAAEESSGSAGGAGGGRAGVEGVLLCFQHEGEVHMSKLEYLDYAQDAFREEYAAADELSSTWSVGHVVTNYGSDSVDNNDMTCSLAWILTD
jgi:hypothetical protein